MNPINGRNHIPSNKFLLIYSQVNNEGEKNKNPKKTILRVAQLKPAAFPRIIFNVENLTSNYVADIAEL
jgi:hypothetical protein